MPVCFGVWGGATNLGQEVASLPNQLRDTESAPQDLFKLKKISCPCLPHPLLSNYNDSIQFRVDRTRVSRCLLETPQNKSPRERIRHGRNERRWTRTSQKSRVPPKSNDSITLLVEQESCYTFTLRKTLRVHKAVPYHCLHNPIRMPH